MSEFSSGNFQGWLLKFGTQEFPHEFIKRATWKSTPNQRLENDPWTDMKGYLHRDVMDHNRTKIEFETVDDLTLEEKIQCQNIINNAITNKAERKGKITYWNDETNTYEDAEVYIPDIDFTVNEIDKKRNMIFYASIRIALIEY
jgi:hypothetical protein